MIKSKKLEKMAILGASGLLLFIAGGNPMVQNTIQSAKNHIEMPTSSAKSYTKIPTSRIDNNNKFNLSKRITTKQFTNENNDELLHKDDVTDSKLNKVISERVDNYLRSVNNLSDYHVHISRITTTSSQGNSLNDSETATITFIRK